MTSIRLRISIFLFSNGGHLLETNDACCNAFTLVWNVVGSVAAIFDSSWKLQTCTCWLFFYQAKEGRIFRNGFLGNESHKTTAIRKLVQYMWWAPQCGEATISTFWFIKYGINGYRKIFTGQTRNKWKAKIEKLVIFYLYQISFLKGAYNLHIKYVAAIAISEPIWNKMDWLY